MPFVYSGYSDNVAVITINNPPVNYFSHAVCHELLDTIKTVQGEDSIEAILLNCSGHTFVSGSGCCPTHSPPAAQVLGDLISSLEGSNIPVVAALKEDAMGVAFEIAMACHYRIATHITQMGLPDLKLGHIPAAGGSQYLPRLVGFDVAMCMVLEGKCMNASMALALEVVDKVFDTANFDEAAIDYAKSMVGRRLVPTSKRKIHVTQNSNELLDDNRRLIAKQFRGYQAYSSALDALDAARIYPFEEGLLRERVHYEECAESSQAISLQHLYLAQQKADRLSNLKDKKNLRPISHVGIVGAGRIGRSIAMSLVKANISVTILEKDEQSIAYCLGSIRDQYNLQVKKGHMTIGQLEEHMSAIKGAVRYKSLENCDLIIEAATENMNIKEMIFRKIDRVAKKGAILASTTTFLDINQLAAVTTRPQDVLGLHFYHPCEVLKLCEVIKGDETNKDVIEAIYHFLQQIDKIGVLSGVCDGYIGTRMFIGYGRQASLAVMEGATPAQVDSALYGFGMEMGPLSSYDMHGLDVSYLNRRLAPSQILEVNAYQWINRLVELDRNGYRSGAGIYNYEAGSQTPISDPFVHMIIEEEAALAGITREAVKDEEIIERCIMSLINEGAKILEEGISERASDIDLVYCYGFGFPHYRGGPMQYADHLGLQYVYERLLHLGKVRGKSLWTISPLIEKLASEGSSFADYDCNNSA